MRSRVAFFSMIFSRLWIIRRLVFIIFFLMADIIFDYGILPSTGFQPRPKRNLSTVAEPVGSELNILNVYLTTVLNKSRALEEVIYSDILNNLRSLIKTDSDELKMNEYKTHDAREKSEKVEHYNRNSKESPVEKTNVFLSGDGRERSRSVSKNVTVRGYENEYLLGYSGSLFGSQQPLPGVVEVVENDPLMAADPRKKRSVLHLYNMVLCTTGCNPFAYKGYGCYCGFLGSGFVVDGIDSCCKMHDWCYNSAGCPMFLEYFIPYLWKCYHRQPLCAIDHGYYGGPSSCAQRLCECDRQLALCLRRYPCPSTKALCTSSPWRLLQNILMF